MSCPYSFHRRKQTTQLHDACEKEPQSLKKIQELVQQNPKAVKNAAEIEGMMEAHLTDGASLARFFCWLEKTVVHDATPVTEVELANKLEAFRASGDGFLELSFPTICGHGPNGAIIHYNPLAAPAEQIATIDGSQMVLLDSGAQYASGTTDVTRTFHLGKPTEWQREVFTRVLKGNLSHLPPPISHLPSPISCC